MKKTRKFLAVFALCFSMLSSYLTVYAAADATKTCTNCGKTAYYSGSVRQSASFVRKHDVIASETGLAATCFIYNVGYLDTYMCGCGVPTRTTRTEEEHSVIHSSAYN